MRHGDGREDPQNDPLMISPGERRQRCPLVSIPAGQVMPIGFVVVVTNPRGIYGRYTQ